MLKLGNLSINRIGLGTNRITDSATSADILHYAVERGIDFIDTAHIYSGGESEREIGRCLAPYPPGLVIASKCGYGTAGIDGTPATLRQQLEQTLISLKTDNVTLYQLHRIDPGVGLEVSLRALKQFQTEGLISHIGLSKVTVEQIKQAQAIATVATVQNHYNLAERASDDVIDYCDAQGIIFIPYFPLGGIDSATAGGEVLNSLAQKYQSTPSQMALAWLLKRSPSMLPIPGTLSRSHLDDNLGASRINLAATDFDALSRAPF